MHFKESIPYGLSLNLALNIHIYMNAFDHGFAISEKYCYHWKMFFLGYKEK